MASSAIAARLRRLRPGRTAAFGLIALVVTEALLVLVYVTSPASGRITDPVTYSWIVLQPFVWINVGVLAVVTTDPPAIDSSRRLLGALLAAGYLLLLAAVGGLLGGGTGTAAFGVNWVLPPGYSPRSFYDGSVLAVTLEPYKLVGYSALAYLVYVTVLDAAGAAISGVVGLLSCVSCTWPIVGTIATSVFGSSSAVAAAALDQAYPLSTLVFLSAVVLLWWRPTLR